MVRLSASAFICATISTSPDAASVVTQVTRPSALNLGLRTRPSSVSFAEPESGKGAGSCKKPSPRQAASPRSAADQRDESHLLGRVLAEDAGELRRDRG